MTIEHIAGKPRNNIQRCRRCSMIIVNANGIEADPIFWSEGPIFHSVDYWSVSQPPGEMEKCEKAGLT